jgi:hypothetical protein
MSEPIIFISNQKIKAGKFEDYKRHYQQTVELIKANKPGTLAHLAFSDKDGTNASIIHVFPDAESLEFHLQGAGDLAQKAFEFMDIVSIELYGRPSDAVLAGMQQIAGSGVELNLKPQNLGGYLRLKADRKT